MGRAAAQGFLAIGSAQGVRILLTTLSTIVAARLLAPSDYGVVAMAAPVTAFVILFQNLGLNQATIQARTLDHEQSSAMFWTNALLSFGIAFALVAFAPAVSAFYGDARAGNIVAASALTVVLNGVAQQHSALLHRELRFTLLSWADILSAAAAFVATIAGALVLRNYWALWLGPFAGALVTAAVVWRASGWRPNLAVSVRGIGEMLRFGGSVTGFNLLNFLRTNLDNIVVAKGYGPSALGLYDQSYRLMMFPIINLNTPVSRVMLPVLSRLQDEPERYRRAFLTAVQAIGLVLSPGVAIAAATSGDLIPFLLGPHWQAASPIFFWMSLAALLLPIANTAGWLFISQRRGRELMQWGVFSAGTAIVGFAVGAHWGPAGVAASIFVGAVVRTPVLYWWATKGNPVRARDLYANLLLSLAIAGCAAFIVVFSRTLIPFAAALAIALVVSYAIALAAQLLTAEGRYLLRWGVDFATAALHRRRAAPHGG
jgi:PST family polysaccharide transporter